MMNLPMNLRNRTRGWSVSATYDWIRHYPHWYPCVTTASVMGLVTTACSSRRRKTRPRLREMRRLNWKVNS